MRLDTTTTIATPERVRFQFRVAGPGRRSLAWGVDAVLQAAILAVMFLGSLLLEVGVGSGWGDGSFLLVVFLVTWFYGAAFETFLHGRTPGKLLLRLRVVTSSGARATPTQVVLRNLLRGADFLPLGYGLGVLAMGLDDRLRRIGDRVAGTVVVDERSTEMLTGVPLVPVTESERRELPARVNLTRAEITAIESFLHRRSRLSDGRAEELAAIFSPVLRDLGVDAASEERVLALGYARATGRDRELEA